MVPGRSYQLSEVARITGVSVRALHHYDDIGLLVPTQRTGAGYRHYHQDDPLRLQQILIGREQGLSLEEVPGGPGVEGRRRRERRPRPP